MRRQIILPDYEREWHSTTTTSTLMRRWPASRQAVEARIQCKICSLCFNASFNLQSLAGLLKIYAPSRQLRSSADACTLCIPFVHTQINGQRAFSHSAPTLWNNLCIAIRNSKSAPFFQIRPKNLSVSALQMNNLCVCVCVCGVCVCACVCVGVSVSGCGCGCVRVWVWFV